MLWVWFRMKARRVICFKRCLFRFSSTRINTRRGKFKSWLFLSARNKVLTFFRDSDKLASLDQTDEEGNAFLHETLPDGERPLLDELSGQETLEQIRRAALMLPPRQREMVYLRQYMSFKEISQVLDRPLGTVLADCHRAVKKLQQLLAEHTEGVNL